VISRGVSSVVSSLPIPDEDDQGHAIPQLVRTRAGLRRIGTAEFVEQPMRRCGQPLLVLDHTTLTHDCGVVGGRVSGRSKVLTRWSSSFGGEIVRLAQCGKRGGLSRAVLLPQAITLDVGCNRTFTDTYMPDPIGAGSVGDM